MIDQCLIFCLDWWYLISMIDLKMSKSKTWTWLIIGWIALSTIIKACREICLSSYHSIPDGQFVSAYIFEKNWLLSWKWNQESDYTIEGIQWLKFSLTFFSIICAFICQKQQYHIPNLCYFPGSSRAIKCWIK